jgi:hypothetical protein
MAELCGNLWEYNLARVVVIDVTDDYRLMQPPLPSDFYPVLKEAWMPAYGLGERLPDAGLVSGYLYDWHESPGSASEPWYVGVVNEQLAQEEGDEPPQPPGAFQLELFSDPATL